jgi:hypothetical protein
MQLKPCPHCHGEHGVSRIRIAFAGRFNPAVCAQCGGKFLPGWWQGWLIGEVLLLPASCAAIGSASSPTFFSLLAIGFVTALVAQELFVPLVRA